MNKTIRVIIVVVLSALVIAQAAADLSRPLGHPLGQYGFTTAGTTVVAVYPGSPAARAGMRRGDVISTAGNSKLLQLEASEDFSGAPGARLNVRVLQPRRRDVTLTSVPESSQEYPYLILRQILYIFTVLAGATLLMLRPGTATWALFIYALGAVGFADAVAVNVFGFTALFANDARVAAATFALIWFGVCVGGQRDDRSHRLLLIAGAALALADFAVNIPFAIGYWAPNLSWTGGVAVMLSALLIVGYVLAAAAILVAYRRTKERHHAALQWIVAGILVSGACVTATQIFYPYLPYAAFALLSTSPALIVIAAAYALLANRIVDLNFVASRALVYGILTSITVGILALVDWFVAKQFDAVRLGFILEVAAALALGVTIQRLHRWSDAVVDKYVFRAAHEAELRLKRLGRALVHAPSREVIDRALCQDAAQTLSLASAAIFRRTGEDQYVRAASFNWESLTLGTLDAGHRLALYLAAEERPIVPSDAFSADEVLPDGVARPALAIPFVVRHQLIGFVLYGSHTNGAHPDGKDVELLTDLTAHASAAYDHVAMEERTNENLQLRTQVTLLRSLVGEVKA